MDVRRILPFLLLAICIISAASAIKNDRDGSNNIRRIRRISLNEYLVPPPPPIFHLGGRTGRLAPQIEEPGYFSRFMSWLNPFGSSWQQPPPPPPPPKHEIPYPPSPKFIQPPPPPLGSPATTYNGPPPVIYDKPSSHNNYPEHPTLAKAKNCNPCNKVPWMPMKHGELYHSEDASFAPPPPSPQQLSPLNNEYLPPRHLGTSHDAHHAASQEIRTPDYSFVPTGGQDGSFIGPIPNPHLYPGAMPPLFKAKDFHYPVQAVSNGNPEYLGVPPPSISGESASIGNDSFSSIAESNFSGGYNGQPIYTGSSSHSNVGTIHQGSGYANPGVSNGEFQHFGVEDHRIHGDLSPSGTQVSQGHADSIPDKQEFENTATRQGSLDSTSHQTSFGSSHVLESQPSAVSNNGEFYGVTGSDRPPDDFVHNSSQIDQNPPSSYGISGLDRIPNNFENQYNDLSSSANVAKNSHASLSASDGSSAKIEDSIHFEESPLLDFTYKGESRTDSSSIPPTSNVFVDFASAETAGTTLASGDEVFGTRQGISSTESHFFADYSQTINSLTPSEKSKINDSATQNSNKSLHNPKALRGQDVSYISSSDHTEHLWPSILSTTLRSTERDVLYPLKFWSSLAEPYDSAEEEALNESVNVNLKDTTSRQQGAKRNKQVQVIIPYTSQYTPLPFHSRKVSHTGQPNHDNYVGEESRNNIKVTSLPDIWSTTSLILEDVTRKPASAKANNSIDVHRLQKNIDNWTIQEYSKGTTASTVSPSSVNPYLFPSKQIPDEYLTTTEAIDHIASPQDNNIKSFTLAGFSFNDLNYKGSASNRMEGSRVQVIKIEKSTENPTDISTKDDVTWQGFSVDISPVNKERVYVVTPQPIATTPKSTFAKQKQEKLAKETERNSKELKKASETDVKNSFELIEKAYQVLPQAVNNLAVASTGPESVPLWGIMEHEEFISPDDSEHDDEDESPEIPVLYAGHSKVSRARR